eukprot:TRINITY_DN5437_c0_g4_i2.p1 TRINITY_DN5437_c0_g4~~TRINITY_DN5437_c0_g4_i2.p1  ORF type:complete len:452 (+),score=69.27 TRINITY_DN5437_c0_g4_i2:407-1762(+)
MEDAFSHKRKHSSSHFLSSPKRFKHDIENKFEERYERFVASNRKFFGRVQREDIRERVKSKLFGNHKKDHKGHIMKPWKDARAVFFNPHWIRGKSCLDIGSGEGIFTIILAVKYSPKLIVGCDIDFQLVNKAISHLHALQDREELFKEIDEPIGVNSCRDERRKELIKKLKVLPKSFTVGLSFPKEYLIIDDSIESNNEDNLMCNDFRNLSEIQIKEEAIKCSELFKQAEISGTINKDSIFGIKVHEIPSTDAITTKKSKAKLNAPKYPQTPKHKRVVNKDSTIMKVEDKFQLTHTALLNMASENKPQANALKHMQIPTLKEALPNTKEASKLDNIIFRQENYIADMRTREQYNTILCMNTSKWIHLAYGDAGIKALFYKVYRSLCPSGIFIFEPQPWGSYTKAKDERYKDIAFLPQRFESFLINEIGFVLLEKIIPELPAKNRPILVFQK